VTSSSSSSRSSSSASHLLTLLLCWCSGVIELRVELLSSLDLVVAAVDRGISRALGFLSRGWGDLYGGARVWTRLRPRDLGIRAEMLGGIVVVRRG
jgi:hypothetical protein